ncbi:hypothetical protein C7974DRAFT_222932 [Boeremia exigua]|uniref:uncharacterized protein n=1 Tax=Boeremia exigua TaxID=749465 RepID=UPI001E8DC847|nr:uncharacterized protein C7974DRAFT_222932 [Boeremia exigua]KAH6619901.1 hypothetical protein C7974DRAFT_222932 [Boeremia exigua]
MFSESNPGTAVGVASLGIQVCQGLLKYYGDWKGYDDDINEVYTGLKDLNQTFQLLKDKLLDLAGTPFVDRAKECLKTCQDNVVQLDARSKKLHIKTPDGYKQKIQAGGLRLLYPFRNGTLSKLKNIVQGLMRQLGLAVQLILLDNSDSTRSTAILVKQSADKISSLATQIESITISTQTQASITAANVQILVSAEDDNELTKILSWLGAPDHNIEHYAARKKHQKGTGEWLLQSEHYQKWFSGSSPLLWLHGKAGCCKTVLSSTVIEDIQHRIAIQHGTVLAFFYFTFSDSRKQTYRGLLLSTVTELSRGRPIIPRLRELYKASVPHVPSVEGLEETLVALLKEANVSYLVADALDECSEEERDEVMQGFKRITQACPNARVLITSRKESDIEDLMQDWCNVQLALDESCVNADIDIFVKDALTSDKTLMRLPDATKEEIERVFHDKSDGMFRWAALQLESIRRLKILRPSYISDALHKMPRTLDETYERVFSAIDDQYFDESKRALYWLAFSARPISVAELAEACSIQIRHNTKPSLDDGGYEAITGLLGVISSFVLIGEPIPPACLNENQEPWPHKFIDASTRQLRLAHFSVKEYLISSRLRDQTTGISRYRLEESNAQYLISQMCCAYFLYFTNEHRVKIWIDEEKAPRGRALGWPLTQSHLKDLTPAFPLLEYVCDHWYEHQKLAESRSGPLREHERFHLQILDNERVRGAWLRLRDPNGFMCMRDASTDIPEPVWHDGSQALYWAALLGLHKTVLMLCECESELDVNHKAGRYGFALQAAAYMGDYDMVSLLMLRGALPDLEWGYFGTALHVAVWRGHERIGAKLLRAAPESVHNASGEYGTALQAAIELGREHYVHMLLQSGADPNSQVKITRPGEGDLEATDTLVLVAAKRGTSNMVDMMIRSGANIDHSSHELLLECARWNSEEDNGESMRTLLQHAVFEISVLNEALLEAIGSNHERNIRTLISAGANPNHLEEVHESAAGLVFRDVEQGKALVELLLELGLAVSGDHHLLIAATFANLGSMVESLLLAGANIHGHNEHTGNALMTAAGCGSTALVKVLIDAGANPNAQHAAIPIVSRPAKTCYSSPYRMTAMIRAMICVIRSPDSSVHVGLAIVQQLINAGVDVNDGGDALCKAIICHESEHDSLLEDHHVKLIVQLLLANGADFSGPLDAIPTLFSTASQEKMSELVDSILEDRYIHSVQFRLLFKSCVTSCFMVHNESWVTKRFLDEELKINPLDLSRACELLSAACWSFDPLDAGEHSYEKDCSSLVRTILDTMLDTMRPDNIVFDGILAGDALESSMDRYLDLSSRDQWSMIVRIILIKKLRKRYPV